MESSSQLTIKNCRIISHGCINVITCVTTSYSIANVYNKCIMLNVNDGRNCKNSAYMTRTIYQIHIQEINNESDRKYVTVYSITTIKYTAMKHT